MRDKVAKDDLDIPAMLDRNNLDLSYRLNCHQIGLITAFDSSRFTCTVKIQGLWGFGDKRQPYPLLVDVPLIVAGAGAGNMTFPDPVGSECLILFNDRDIDKWFEAGAAFQPNTSRAHDLSDALAIMRPRNLTNPITGYDSTAVTIWHGGRVIKLTPSLITLTNGSTQIEMTTTTIKEIAGNTVFFMDGTKFNFTNGADSLTSILIDWVTACENIEVSPSTHLLTPASKAAFTAIKTRLQGLLSV